MIEQMFNLYVPTKGEIEDFLDRNLEFYTETVSEICDDDEEKQKKLYSEIKSQVTCTIEELFKRRFERLSGLANHSEKGSLKDL